MIYTHIAARRQGLRDRRAEAELLLSILRKSSSEIVLSAWHLAAKSIGVQRCASGGCSVRRQSEIAFEHFASYNTSCGCTVGSTLRLPREGLLWPKKEGTSTLISRHRHLDVGIPIAVPGDSGISSSVHRHRYLDGILSSVV